MQLRDYQIQASKQGKEILLKYHLVYLAFEVRLLNVLNNRYYV